MMVIWVLLIVGGVCVVGWCIYTLSISHNNQAYGIDRSESEPTVKAGIKKADSSMDASSKGPDFLKQCAKHCVHTH